MAIKTFDFVLEDNGGVPHQYTANQLGAMQSFSMLQKLAKALGTAGTAGDIGSGEDKTSKMGMAIVGALGEPEVFEIVKELFAYKVLRDDKKLMPDEDFRGNMGEMVELIVELVKINWGHLFEQQGKLKQLLGKFNTQK